MLRTHVRGMHYRYSNLLRSVVLESFRSLWSVLSLPGRQRVHVSSESCSGLPSGMTMMRKLHETAYQTLLSIVGVPGEVSRQQVASFFPVASHSWSSAAGSRARQGGNCPNLDVTLSGKR